LAQYVLLNSVIVDKLTFPIMEKFNVMEDQKEKGGKP